VTSTLSPDLKVLSYQIRNLMQPYKGCDHQPVDGQALRAVAMNPQPKVIL